MTKQSNFASRNIDSKMLALYYSQHLLGFVRKEIQSKQKLDHISIKLQEVYFAVKALYLFRATCG